MQRIDPYKTYLQSLINLVFAAIPCFRWLYVGTSRTQGLIDLFGTISINAFPIYYPFYTLLFVMYVVPLFKKDFCFLPSFFTFIDPIRRPSEMMHHMQSNWNENVGVMCFVQVVAYCSIIDSTTHSSSNSHFTFKWFRSHCSSYISFASLSSISNHKLEIWEKKHKVQQTDNRIKCFIKVTPISAY